MEELKERNRRIRTGEEKGEEEGVETERGGIKTKKGLRGKNKRRGSRKGEIREEIGRIEGKNGRRGEEIRGWERRD